MKKNIVIIMLTVLVLGLCGYLVYDKVLSNNIEEVKEESYDLASAKFIIDSFLNANMYNIIDRIVETKLDEDTKLAIAIGSIESLESYSCNELFDTTNGYYENNGAICSSYPNQYSYERVNARYKKIFGSLKEAPKKDLLYRYEVYDYSDKKDVYVELEPQFGPIIPNLYYYEVKEAKINNNELKINISYLTYKVNPLVEPEHISYKINNVEYTIEKEDNIKQIYSDNENSLPTLTFVFEKENNNYILKYVE